MAATRVLIVLVLAACAGVVHTTSAMLKVKAALFVFGDSLYDPGNNNYINTTSQYQANFWPYGESFFNPPTGRFTDGRTIPDFIAEFAGLPLLQAYLKPGADQNYVYGSNFASAGAGGLHETQLGYVVSLKEQLAYFKDVKKKLRKKVGNDEAERVVSNAVYLLSFGSNDYSIINTTGGEEFYHSYTQHQYVGMVVGNITMLIKEIYKLGGRKFGFVNMPALGRFPGSRVGVPAELAGLPLLDAYLKPGADQNYVYGANFASGGAGALQETNLGYVVGLKEQLAQFKDVKKKLRKKFGNDEAERVVSDAVYLLCFGCNEYSRINNHAGAELYHSYTPNQYVEVVVGNITMLIKEIYKVGGRKFGFVNMPAVGRLPGSRAYLPGNGEYEEMNILAKMHNQKFSESLVDLEKLTGFTYSMFDIATAIANRMNNPLKYGFKEGMKACCGFGPINGIYSCGGKREDVGLDYLLCDDPTQNFFFDSYHPCQVAYKQLANLFWNGNINVVRPYNFKNLFHGFGPQEKEEQPIAEE